MLLNFLIAMMNSIYTDIQENSTQEYRWIMTRDITQLQFSPWPVPLNLLQAVIALAIVFSGKLQTIIMEIDVEYQKRKVDIGQVDSEAKQLLYANMAISYFRETLKEAEYKESLLFDDPPVNTTINE